MSCAVGSSINTSSIVAPCSASGPWFVVRKRKTQPQCVITAGLSLPYPFLTLKFEDLGLIQSGGHRSWNFRMMLTDWLHEVHTIHVSPGRRSALALASFFAKPTVVFPNWFPLRNIPTGLSTSKNARCGGVHRM